MVLTKNKSLFYKRGQRYSGLSPLSSVLSFHYIYIYDILSRFFEVSSDLICLNLKLLYIPRTDSCINNAFRSDFNLSKKKVFLLPRGYIYQSENKRTFYLSRYSPTNKGSIGSEKSCTISIKVELIMGSFNDINYQIALRREILVCVQYTQDNQFPI